jgi:hemin uptake protein HemP
MMIRSGHVVVKCETKNTVRIVDGNHVCKGDDRIKIDHTGTGFEGVTQNGGR